jgi:hypothetical protein
VDPFGFHRHDALHRHHEFEGPEDADPFGLDRRSALRRHQKMPTLGHKLGFFLLPASRQDEVLGDLDERFKKRWLGTLGPRAA